MLQLNGIEKMNSTDINKYVVAFLRKLLLQREKLEKRMLENYLIPMIAKQWQEVLSSLEETNRKVINIESGSLMVTLFCPTIESRLQLRDETWRIAVQQKTAKLLQMLGKF